MKICDVASFAWDNAREIEFGKRASWEQDTFTSKWFSINYPNVWEKGTDITAIVTKNEEIFKGNLSKPDNDGFMVIYNGHEQNVFARIRSHFALNNDRTTAIGFGKYAISNYDLRVRIFHHKLPMDGLSEEEKLFVQNLLKEKAGREAGESSWRAYNGWPVLCKR